MARNARLCGVESVLRLGDGAAAGVTPGGAILRHRPGAPGARSIVVTLQWVSELRGRLGPPTAASPR